MCGRYTITITIDELLFRYMVDATSTPFHIPRYNVAPMQMIPAIIYDGRTRRLGPLRWGLVPAWAKDEKIANHTINARSETLMEKASFKHIVRKKRCLIPADSFYEWKVVNSSKQPMRIMLKSKKVFSMAGLYDTWIHPQSGEKISSCTIITTPANRFMQPIHDRMPAILREEDEHRWLSDQITDEHELLTLLRPYPDEEMTAYPVTTLVNKVQNDSPQCVTPSEYVQQELF